jgi:hypothetical protein
MEGFCQSNYGWSADYVRRVVRAIEFNQGQRLVQTTTGEAAPVAASVREAESLKRKSKPITLEIMPARKDHSQLTRYVPPPPMPPPLPVASRVDVRHDLFCAIEYADKLLHRVDMTYDALRVVRHLMEMLGRVQVAFAAELPGLECVAGGRAKSRGTQEKIVAFAVKELGLKAVDGDWFWNKMLGSGWKNGGIPIADWEAVMRTWQTMKVFPSQKVVVNGKVVVKDQALADKQHLKDLEQANKLL